MARPTVETGAAVLNEWEWPILVLVASLLGVHIFSDSAVRAQGEKALTVTAKTLTVSTNFEINETIAPDKQIELRLSRPLQLNAESLAVFVGQTDMTSVFNVTERRLIYLPKALLLPPGENTLTVYLVSGGDDWSQIASFPFRATGNGSPESAKKAESNGKFGFEKFEFRPSLAVNIKSESAVLYSPDSNRPQRLNFIDVAFQGSLQSDVARGRFNSQSQFDFVGTTYQREALRFGERQEAAPQIDLSSYLTNIQVNKVKIVLGHSSFGTNRYLINGFSSRGLTVTVPFNDRADFSFAAMNGTSVVGWSNFLGLRQRKHRFFSGVLGFEFLPKRRGGLRLEVGVLRGSLLPVSNFNQSNLTDAERSTGFGVRVVASDKEGRLRLDLGFGRSRFGNPADPLLNQGFTVIPVREAAKNARYLDLSYQLLKDVSLTKNRKVNLSVAFRHNRVDPLFRSTALFAQADRQDNQFELTGNIGEINLGGSFNRSNDNLDSIVSILKTLTRRSGFQVNGPFIALFGAKGGNSKWLPRFSYSFDRTHAYGAFLPIGGGFSDSHVPDQASTNQSFNADWQYAKWRFGYRVNQSFQDNRQIGRQNADLKNLSNSFGLGVTPHSRLNLNFDLSAERARNLETATLDRNLRAGVSFNFQTTKKSMFAATISSAFAGDAAGTRRNRNADMDLQWSIRFGVYEQERYRKIQGQFFIRYANRYASSRDNVFFFNNLTKIQTMNAGLGFTFF